MRRFRLAPIPFVLFLLALVRPAVAADPPFSIVRFDLQPPLVQAGTPVTATLATVSNGATAATATLDLSALGLSPTTPMAKNASPNPTFTATFTVPPGVAPGDYTLLATVRDDQGNASAPATVLHVTAGAIIRSVTSQPSTVQPGAATALTATVSPGDRPVVSITADLSAFGLSAATALAKTGDDTYSVSFTVPASRQDGSVTIPVLLTDAASRTAPGTAALSIVRVYPPVLFSLALNPSDARPGQSVLIDARFLVNNCELQTVTADLSAFGLSSEYLLPGTVQSRSARFDVPDAMPEGRVPITLTVKSDCGGAQAYTATLNVTRGPIVTSVTFENPTVPPGGSTTIRATVDPGVKPLAGVTADLSAFGLSATEPLGNDGSPAYYYKSFNIPANTPVGGYFVPVTATDTEGRASTASARLAVGSPTGPYILDVKANPQTVHAGQAVTLKLTIGSPGCAIYSLYADLSAYGLPAANYQGNSPSERTLAFTVPASVPPGDYRIVSALGAECGDASQRGVLLAILPFVVKGDVNGDAVFTMADVAAVLRSAGGLAPSTGGVLSQGDVGGGGADGRSPDGRITVLDALRLARALAHTDTLP